MTALDDRGIAAIRQILNDQSDPGYRQGAPQQLFWCKSDEAKVLQLKQDGNGHFRKKQFVAATHKYTQAILEAPWTDNERRKTVQECLASLLRDSPTKQKVAEKLYAVTESSGDVSEKKQSTPLLATCIGNRSAALFEMGKIEECLCDIDLALSHGYAVSSVEDKLMRRREKCLARWRSRRTHSTETRSSVKENDDSKLCSAFESKHITVMSNHTRGRYIQALCDLRPGDVVISEKPYAAVLDNQFTHTHCSICFKESLTLIPCFNCSSEGYCCSQCRSEAWKGYHWLECPVANIWMKEDWMMRLCLRILLRTGPEEIVNTIRHQSTHDSRGGGYATVYSLVAHEDKFVDESQKRTVEKMTDVLFRCFGDSIITYLQASDSSLVPAEVFTDQSSQAGSMADSLATLRAGLGQLFRHHLLQLRCNTHFVSALMSDGAKESMHGIETTSEVKLGSAVYPTASLMNHSCAPNAFFRFVGNHVVVCVTDKVKAGQEINNSYGPQIGRMKRSVRQKILKEKYFFDCHCIACRRLDPDLVQAEVVCDALLCPSCTTEPLEPVVADASTTTYKCCDCHCSISSETLAKHIQIRDETREMFAKGTASSEASVPLLLKCLKKQGKVFHRHNLELARTNDTLAQLYAMQGDFQSALPYCRKSCETVGVVYGRNSVEVANEKEKLAHLLFQSGCYESALKTAQEALQLLRVYRGEHCQESQELNEMIDLLAQS